MSAHKIPLRISYFDRAIAPKGEAIGIQTRTTWQEFVDKLSHRRQGAKDGLCFAPATFETKPDGIHVGRTKAGALSRTAIVLDIETSKITGEIPPPPDEALSRAAGLGLAAVVYTSHNHHPTKDPRYRVAIALSDEIACEIPAPEIIAEELRLIGVLDKSKIGPASLFYAPSRPKDAQDLHYFESIDGMPVDADRITETGVVLLRARKAEEDRVAAEAQAEAAARRDAKIAAGLDPDDSLIEKIRVRLDLEQILLSHGYDKKGHNYRHPNSSSGLYGANIKALGGIDRIFSHNATDPLHETNLPKWCGRVRALDAFDVLAILEFCGDRKKAIAGLADRFGLSKRTENKALAALLFRMIRRCASQEEIEIAVLAEGARLGLSHDEVYRVAVWVRQKSIDARRAA
jgi:hypothetical protein